MKQGRCLFFRSTIVIKQLCAKARNRQAKYSYLFNKEKGSALTADPPNLYKCGAISLSLWEENQVPQNKDKHTSDLQADIKTKKFNTCLQVQIPSKTSNNYQQDLSLDYHDQTTAEECLASTTTCRQFQTGTKLEGNSTIDLTDVSFFSLKN